MITVIIATFNGARTLGATLEALGRINAPEGGWKLIVVDNGSVDGTPQIIAAHADRLPLHALHIAQRGKNRALNAALEWVEGDLVVFTDDDVIPDADWLCSLHDAARRQPNFGIFGGAIVPHWPSPPKPWIGNHVALGMTFAVSDPALPEGPVDHGHVWGPNMAVRADNFRAGLRFDVKVGPNGSSNYVMGSETELIARMAERGIKSWFCQSARVQHLIRAEQMSKAWVLRRYFRHGRALYLFRRRRTKGLRLLFGIEPWLLREVFTNLAKALLWVLLVRTDRAFVAAQGLYRSAGMFYQCKLMSRTEGGAG